jgi:hypothetical protein
MPTDELLFRRTRRRQKLFGNGRCSAGLTSQRGRHSDDLASVSGTSVEAR